MLIRTPMTLVSFACKGAASHDLRTNMRTGDLVLGTHCKIGVIAQSGTCACRPGRAFPNLAHFIPGLEFLSSIHDAMVHHARSPTSSQPNLLVGDEEVQAAARSMGVPPHGRLSRQYQIWDRS